LADAVDGMTATFEFLEPTATGLSCCPVRTLAGAYFRPDRLERFALWRRWSDAPSLGFLLMNPSIADEDRLDQTLKRCASWARSLGYGGMEIVNVFPLVSTDPRGLGAHDHDETAARNAANIRDLARRTTLILGFGDLLTAAWLRRLATPRLQEIVGALDGLEVYALAVTENGSPRHPLARGRQHIASSATPTPYLLAPLIARL